MYFFYLLVGGKNNKDGRIGENTEYKSYTVTRKHSYTGMNPGTLDLQNIEINEITIQNCEDMLKKVDPNIKFSLSNTSEEEASNARKENIIYRILLITEKKIEMASH